MNEIQSFLKSVSFKDLENWSVQYLLETSFSYNESYPLVKIGSFLTRNKTQIIVQDDVEYKRVTIKINNGGIFLRDKKIGKDIGTKKQFIIKKGQFLLSKIDARNGAFGIATNEVDNAIITADFFAYDIDTTKIKPLFLVLITTTKQFKDFAQSASSGTTNRQRINEAQFLNVKIPLPSPQQQEEILNKYNDKIELAKQQEQEAKEIEENLETYLNTQIGIEVKLAQEKTSSLLNFVNYIELDKWGVDKVSPQSNIKYTKNFPKKAIKKLCKIGSGGTPSRSNKEYYTGDIPWIKTGEVINDIIYDTEEKITEEAIANSSAKIYPKDSLIIAMYGQGLTRGRTAKLGIDASTNQACAVLYDIDNSIIDTDYLWFYMMNEYHRLRELASGNNQPNLNAEMIKNYKVVIPDLDTQKMIVQEIKKRKEQIKKLKNEAHKNRELAIEEFEREIFNEA